MRSPLLQLKLKERLLISFVCDPKNAALALYCDNMYFDNMITLVMSIIAYLNFLHGCQLGILKLLFNRFSSKTDVLSY